MATLDRSDDEIGENSKVEKWCDVLYVLVGTYIVTGISKKNHSKIESDDHGCYTSSNKPVAGLFLSMCLRGEIN